MGVGDAIDLEARVMVKDEELHERKRMVTLTKTKAVIGNVSHCHVLTPFLSVLHAFPLW